MASVADAQPAADPQGADAMLAADTAATGPDPSAIREDGPAVCAQIRKWLDEARPPTWLQNAYTQWTRDQKYVHTELFYDDQPNVMGINLAARLIQAKLSSIMPSDNDVSIKHDRAIADAATVRRDAMREARNMLVSKGLWSSNPVNPQQQAMNAMGLMMMTQAADAAEQEYKLELEARERFASTAEALVKKLHDEANGTEVARDCALSTFTTGISFAKIGWQKDYGRDSVGAFRNDDAQDQIALLALRASEYEAGLFAEGDAKFDELMHLTRYAQEQGKKVMGGEAEDPTLPLNQWSKIVDTRDGEAASSQWLPEPDVWEGATLDHVQPHNMRWDWRVPFSQWKKADWVMEQVPKDLDTAAAEYHLTPAERDAIGGFIANATGNATGLSGTNRNLGKENADPNNVDYDSNIQLGKVVVWDRWERKTRRHVVFIEGLDRYLIDEVPTVTTPWFYPYSELGFNVLDGAFLPVSEVRFLRKICDAINQRLTDSQESLWASMKRYIVKKGAFKEGEIEKFRGAVPHDVIEMESPEEIAATFHELASDDWNPEKYKLDDLFRLLELVMGMSLAQLGVVDVANTATEASIAESRSQQQSARHGLILAEFVQRMFTGILHFSVTCMSQDTVKGLLNTSAYWPMPPTRIDLLRGMKVKVDAAGSRQQTRQRESEDLQRTMATLNAILDLEMKAMANGRTLDVQPLISRALRAGDVDASYRDLFGSAKPSMAIPGGVPLPGGATAGQPGAGPALPGGGGTQRAPGTQNLPKAPNVDVPPAPPVQNR